MVNASNGNVDFVEVNAGAGAMQRTIA